jgi:hypothetical protein
MIGGYYDMLHAADFVVDDVDAACRSAVSVVGLPEPRPDWFQRFPGYGYEAVFARVTPSRSTAPTRLELIADAAVPLDGDMSIPRSYISAMAGLQGTRPVKTHATVTTSSRMDDLLEHVRSSGVRHRVDPPSAALPHERLWIGVTPEEPDNYCPDDDAGLIFEVIPTDCLRLRPEIFALEPGDGGVEEGAMVRIDARCFLVNDMAATIETLERRLLWTCSSCIADPATKASRARMDVAIPSGATLELVQPGGSLGPEREFLSRYGPGAYSVRILVNGLDAAIEDLRQRGTRFEEFGGDAIAPRAVRIEGSQTPGMLFELADVVES